MGLSASQGRLLTITARLTSNEYESQQISNAKMRLSVQTQEASQEYISALNKQVFNFLTFDNNGNSVTTPLTAATLYEYNDTKNQYILSNVSGKVFLTHEDVENYESANDLEDFLTKYGLNKIFLTQALKDSYNAVRTVQMDNYKKEYENTAKSYRTLQNQKTWLDAKNSTQADYLTKLHEYELKNNRQITGGDVTNEEIEEAQRLMEEARDAFKPNVTFESWIENKIKTDNPGVYDNYQKYKTALAIYTDELDNEGVTPSHAYQWDDQTKAQWYTNLWYKINGSSTGNMHTNNYTEMDDKMANSSNWVSDAIAKGNVNIEAVSYTDSDMSLKYGDDPFIFTINGIQWEAKIYSTCPDIVASDNEKAVAQAEAEYQRKTAEINAKDEKYQRKLTLLDAEHNAIQTEYESVKSAIDKNISRSFKAFQG